MSRFIAFLLASAVAVGCSSEDAVTPDTSDASVDHNIASDDTGDDEDASIDAAHVDAALDAKHDAHDAGPPYDPLSVPQIEWLGGPVMTAPKFLPIYYATDPRAADIVQFGSAIAGSNYWTTTTSEYGVGPLTTLSPIVLNETPPSTLTDADIKSWLTNQLGGVSPAWGAPDAQKIYTFFFTDQTTISLPGFGSSCAGFGGYHNEVNIGGTKVPYAVIAGCNSNNVQTTTYVIAHELVEAATDPYPQSDTAYSQPDHDHFIWAVWPGGELGDMCSSQGGSIQPAELGYTVPRMWSNASAAAFHDPCVPIPDGAYFISIPLMTETVYIGGGLKTHGVKVPLGTSKTIPVKLVSDAPTSGPWELSVQPFGNNELQVTLDNNHGQEGDTINMTITRLAEGPAGVHGIDGTEFQFVSHLDSKWVMYCGFVSN